MSNKFLGSDITNMNLTNGTATIYAGSLGSQSLNSSMPVKTNALRNLISSKLDIADINNLQSELDSGIRNPFPSTLIVADLKTDNIVSVDSAITTLQNTAVSNPSASSIEAQGFIVTGGTNQQYLMANGSVLQQSAVSGNSNFYLYNSNNTTSGPPNNGQVRFNNVEQKSATMVYISHLTRDNIDIEVFYNQITQLNDVYIQDQESSQNYIKYNINGLPIIIPNNSISIPVDWIESGGTGETSFNPVGSNNHNIMVSFFSNLTEIDERISTVENKTRNQSAIAGNTTFSGNVFGGSFAVSGQTGFLKANGNIDNNTYLTTGDASSTYLAKTGGSIGNNYITTTQTVFNNSTELVPKTYVDTAIGIGTNNTTERWINSYIGSDVNSGSVLKPLATINAGFGNSAVYPLKLNIRGVFSALQTITGSQPNLQITTTDGYESQQSTLNASVITSGTATRLKMSGFTINAGSSAVLTFGDSLGRHTFSNIQFVSSNATPITFNSGFTNWCNFQDCDFSGLSAGGITLPNLGSGTAILRLYNCGVVGLTTGIGWVVYISGSTVLTAQPLTSLASGTIIPLPFNSFNAVLTSSPVWSTLPVGNYINMVGASLTGVIGTPTLGCCVIKIATGVQVVSLGYNQLPSSINVLNSSNYDTYVRTSGAVGWVVVNQSAYLPLAGGALTGQVSTNQTPTLSTHLVPKSYVDTFLPKAGGSVSGVIDMGSSGSITSNQAIFAGNNFVTKTYVDSAVSTGGGAYVPLAGNVSLTGPLTMGTNAINTTQSTFTSGQLVSKNYVDNAVSGSGSVYLLKAGGNLNYDAQLFNYCNIPIDIPYLKACLFFSGSTVITMYSTNADFSAPTGYKYIGNTAIASIQQTNTSNYNKLIKYAFSTTTGAYFSAGFLCDNTWLFRDKIAGACALYIGMGWKVSFNFSIGDTVAGSQTSGMAIGFYTSTTAPNWSASLKPSTLPNFFGIGNDNGGNFINFFSNGSTFVSNTATTYPTATPQTDKWFNLTMYNPPMTNDVVLILNEVLGNTSITQKYTFLTNNSTINPNMPLYPMMQRYHGSPTVAGQAVLNVGKFTIGLLIN